MATLQEKYLSANAAKAEAFAAVHAREDYLRLNPQTQNDHGFDPVLAELQIVALKADRAAQLCAVTLNRKGSDIEIVRGYLLAELGLVRDVFASLEAQIPAPAPLAVSADVATYAGQLESHAAAVAESLTRAQVARDRIAAAYRAASEADALLFAERKAAGLPAPKRVVPPAHLDQPLFGGMRPPTNAAECDAHIAFVESQRAVPVLNGESTLDSQIKMTSAALEAFRKAEAVKAEAEERKRARVA